MSQPLIYLLQDTVQTFSKTMNKEVPAIVVTPDSYTQETISPGVSIAVIVVTMQVYGFAEIEKMADQYNFIVVCADGNFQVGISIVHLTALR